MKVTALLDNFNNNIEKIGHLDPEISNIEFDSRRVVDGTLFFALKGIHTDGHNYIEKAIALGAKVICISDKIEEYNPSVVYLKVEDTKVALSKLSAIFYNNPSKELKVIGITGTDGKSTTVSLVDQFLGLLGLNSGYISTISFKSGNVEEKNVLRQSTPEANQIHSILRDMVNNKKEYAVVESTSHGLSNKTCRLLDVDFDCGILTNITQEHLEFHGTLEQYRSDKGNLFRKIGTTKKQNSFGVINMDDPECNNFIEYAGKKKCYTYSVKNNNADIIAKNIKLDPEGSNFTLEIDGKIEHIRLNLPGIFNIENTLAALLAVKYITNISFSKIIGLIPELKSVKGRLNPVESKADFSVVVDYAHTPGAFRKVLPSIKNIITGRLIVVFGSAGERDVTKRSVQGSIADEFANIIILTDEDPRLEDSMLIPNRMDAIKKAMDIALAGDMILTLGKGHESSMVYAHGSEPWNEIEIVESLLKDKNLL
ncbi:MAG: UDP-N-acetylmuramoyl-L-alanyl-D-glutamate--2,6-diaminopimelate ligase [Spirochaetaceae bacterium 4572_7]|nr:MAG: UDP-N-acetylmuramoyl-L-alanyl-D-glutamate--2,6-diaminopimelate ligase [Spirochaetaceae bacterium 4572_7]